MGEGRGGEERGRGEEGEGEGRRGRGGGEKRERGRGGIGLRVHVCTYTHGSLVQTPIIISFLLTQEVFAKLIGFSDGLPLKKEGKCH